MSKYKVHVFTHDSKCKQGSIAVHLKRQPRLCRGKNKPRATWDLSEMALSSVITRNTRIILDTLTLIQNQSGQSVGISVDELKHHGGFIQPTRFKNMQCWVYFLLEEGD